MLPSPQAWARTARRHVKKTQRVREAFEVAEGAPGSSAAQTGLSLMSKSQKRHQSLGRHTGRKPLRAEILLRADLSYMTLPALAHPAGSPSSAGTAQPEPLCVALDKRGAHGDSEAVSSSGSGSEL